MVNFVYTVGHSNRSFSEFVALLRQGDVTAVADVRSKPYSAAQPHFDRETLEWSLSKREIKYVFLGRELGGRAANEDCYLNGKVDYDRVAETQEFQTGLSRIVAGVKKSYRIALMCAEKDPIFCHRGILVSRHLTEMGLKVTHLIDADVFEDHCQMIERLIASLRVKELFNGKPERDLIRIAYELQGDSIAFRKAEGTSMCRQLPLQ